MVHDFEKTATPIGLCMSQDPVAVDSKSRNKELSHEKNFLYEKLKKYKIKEKFGAGTIRNLC